MFTQKKFRKNPELMGKAKLLMSIMTAYVLERFSRIDLLSFGIPGVLCDQHLSFGCHWL
jgi:hypothetical protein